MSAPTLDLSTVTLGSGSHRSAEEGMCVMEAVSFVAGEPWSDHPKCASRVIGDFLRAWNDCLDDADRQLLVPLIPRLVGTAAARELEARRAWLAADWFVRVYTPAWLRAAGLTEQADAVAALPEIRGAADMTPDVTATLGTARTAAEAAWSAARSAAWSAAESAAWSAAESAARSAAWSAAESAARSAAWSAARSAAESAAWSAARSAAWSAARSAARSAAWSAAESAARSAAESKLRPVVLWLQRSALELVVRMIELI